MRPQLLPKSARPRRNLWLWYCSRTRRMQIGLVCVLLVTLVVFGLGISLVLSRNIPTTVVSMSERQRLGTGPLPGQQIWKDGVSSYIFGTTDTGEWDAPNIEFTDSMSAPGTPNAVVQNLVKQAGFSLMRKFIGHHDGAHGAETTDADLQAISATMVNAGTQCFVNLDSIDLSSSSQQAGDKYTDLQFAQHVVAMFDGHHAGYIKCSMFEIGNEPDLNGDGMNKYLTSWAIFVTTLKQIRPDAKFIGPAAGANADDIHSFLQGIVQHHYPVPDAISWHWYPCGYGIDAVWSNCLATVMDDPVSDAANIREELQNVLGYQLPIGISEWSADPSGNMSSTGPEMSQFVTKALQSMIKAKLDFANEFDMQSFAAYGGLDMIDGNNQPKPFFYTFVGVIRQYKP